MIIFTPGLDLPTLLEYSSAAPFLSSLTTPNTCTSLQNKSNTSYLPLISPHKPKKILKPKLTLEDHLLTPADLLENNYIFSENFKKCSNKLSDTNLTMIGLDCEMVKCTDGPQLARVTVVDKNFQVVYDKYVKPLSEITDYLTQYSGITQEIMNTTTITAEQVREEILEIISDDTVICGHSLENDLSQLEIIHDKILDTSLMYPHPVLGFKHSLKSLACRYLKKNIQAVRDMQGSHDSVEDAAAALELVYTKLQNGPDFGNCGGREEENFISILEKEGKSVKVMEYGEGFLEEIRGGKGVVVSAWKEIEEDQDFEARYENVPKVLGEWDKRVREVFNRVDRHTGIIIASGTGDSGLAE